MSGHVQNCHFYYIQPGCECGLQTRDHWAPSWNLGWISKIILSVLDQVRTKFGPWNPEYGPKRDFGKVTSFRPTIFGHPVLSRIVPYSGFQGPNLVRTWSRTLRMILDIQPKFQLGAQWLYIVKVAILDMPTHLIWARPKTGFGHSKCPRPSSDQVRALEP